MFFLASACAGADTVPVGDSDEAGEQAGIGADSVVLTSGDTETGTILAESEASVVLAQRYGTLTIPRADIASLRKGDAAKSPAPPAASSGRLPNFQAVLALVKQKPWASDLHQIPATVIDIGVMRSVPYVSHRAGRLEINVYGDPDHPAGVEVGVHEDTDGAKKEIQQLMLELLQSAGDKEILRSISLVEGKQERAGLTFEVTPATAPDAYGFWWISIYDLPALQRARCTDAEMAAISATPPVPEPGAGSATSSPSASPRSAPAASSSSYTRSDYSSPKASRSSGGSGSRVYVRGYSKKNGTYVQPHTRSRGRRR